MNIVQLQEALKGMSEQQLAQEIKQPSGMAPTFLVASELDRRNKMKQRYAERAPQSTVVDDLTMGMGLGSMMAQQPKPVQGMFGGGFLARMLPFMGRGRQAVVPSSLPSPVIGSGATVGRTGIAPQSGGTNMPMTPIDPSKLPVPYVEPTRMQKGLNFLKGNKGKFLLGGAPGVALMGMSGDGLGDGTMAGRFGLTPEEYELLVAEAEKRDITPYDERFAGLAQSVVNSRGDVAAGQRAAATDKLTGKTEQDKAQRTIMDMIRERDQRRKAIAGAQFGLGMMASGKPLLDAAGEAGLPALDTLSKVGTEEFQLALAKTKSRGNLPDMIKYRAELGKLMADPLLSPDQKEQVRIALSQLDARIQLMMGMAGAAPQADPSQSLQAELAKRSA
jgi:hypothetical protein